MRLGAALQEEELITVSNPRVAVNLQRAIVLAVHGRRGNMSRLRAPFVALGRWFERDLAAAWK